MSDSPQQEKKRPGRRPKVAGDHKNSSLTFRTRGGIREKLEASAKARDLSVSEEVERRIMLSFDLASNPSNEYIIRTIATALQLSEDLTNRKWTDDRTTAKMACAAMQAAASIILAHHTEEGANPEYTALAEKVGMATALTAASIYSAMPIDNLLEITRPDRTAFLGLQAMIEPVPTSTQTLARALRGEILAKGGPDPAIAPDAKS